MSFISVDSDNSLAVRDAYADRVAVADVGGRWDAEAGVWRVAFTVENLNLLLDKLDKPVVSQDMEERLAEQQEREAKLERLRSMSKSDALVNLRVPGLRATLYNYQKLGVMYSVANGTGVLLADEMGLGKAQPLDAKILTPSGWKNMGEIRRGDYVFDENGLAVRVMGVFPQGKKDVFRVVFSDGSRTECCEEHLWQVNTACRKNRGGIPLVMMLKDIVRKGLTKKNGKNGTRNNWYIPMVGAMDFSRSGDLDVVPPYVMGILLGDGGLSCMRLGFSSMDGGILRKAEAMMPVGWRFRKTGRKHGYELCLHGANQTNPVHALFRRHGLKGKKTYEKHIPESYLMSPVSDRLELLRGLMDMDGTVGVGKRGNVAQFCTTSRALRDGVVFICRSLGGTAGVSWKYPFYYDGNGNQVKCRKAWVVTVSLPAGMCPFSLHRKDVIYPNARNKYQPVRAMVSVRRVGKKPCQCIVVDSKSGLYVTDDFIVTHNTIQAMATAIMLKAQGKAKNALIVTPASLKFNWPLEIEKFTDEKYVVVDGTPEERVAQWLRNDVFFHVVNTELLLEDLFGGREFKQKKNETAEQKARREAMTRKAGIRKRVLAGVRGRMWDFLAVDECFPYGTIVMTDRGMLPIGHVVENKLDVSVLCCDFSSNESSYRRVVRWIRNPLIGDLVEVTHEQGSFVCTGSHKVWTEEHGLLRAGELSGRGGKTHLRVLPSGVRRSQAWKDDSQILFQEMLREDSLGCTGGVKGSKTRGEGLFVLSEGVLGGKKRQDDSSVLLQPVCNAVDLVATRCHGEDGSTRCRQKDAESGNLVQAVSSTVCCQDIQRTGEGVLLPALRGGVAHSERGGMERQDGEDAEGGDDCCEGSMQSCGCGKNEEDESRPDVPTEGVGWGCKVEGDASFVSGEGRKAVYHQAAEDVVRGIGEGMGDGTQGGRFEICRCVEKSSEVLSDRCGTSGVENSGGSGWKDTENFEVENHRCEEGEGFVLSGVESVKVLERADFERLGIGTPEDTVVYNLEVEEPHYYVANGVLVSNCHSLKHHSSKRARNVKELRAKFRMGLTGTPMDGRLEELHSVMGFVAPGLLSSKTRFFQRHVSTDIWGRVTGYKRVTEVSRKIQPFFLRRLKKDVLADLPDKIYENRFVVLTPEERKIYGQLADHGHEATEDAQAIVAVIRCKQFCNWPRMVDDGCVAGSKMDAFKEVLDEVVVQNGHKALIFSQYREMLDVLVKELDGMGVKYLRIDGGVGKSDRVAMQKTFDEDRSIDVMIGTEAMSTGLNFTAADFVVNYDDNWSPAIMSQREDRCHRIGQRNVVTVVNFVCKDTVEERIRSVIYHKNKITSQVLGDETDEMVLQRLGPKEMAKLL